MDTAHVCATLHLEVAVVTPGGTPRVLNDPVVDVVVSAVSDSQDGMIYVHGSILAGGVSIDTGLVITESGDNLESNRDGSNHEEVVAEVLLREGDVVGATNDAN